MKKQVLMSICFCILTANIFAASYTAKKAQFDQWNRRQFGANNLWSHQESDTNGHPVGEKAPWGGSLLGLSATGPWEVTAITTNAEGALLVTGWFRGALFWTNGHLEADQRVWGFVMISGPDGSLGEPRLLGWESGYMPLNARSFDGGFLILALDLEKGTPHCLRLDSAGEVIERSIPEYLDWEWVVQPEDLPEGSGG